MIFLTVRKINHFFRSLWFKAIPAAIYYGFPGKKLLVYGITGTDGKTTSSTLLYHVLKTAGYKVALISTVAAFIGDEEIDTGFHVTSPEPWAVQKLLRTCLQKGVEHVVLEVTSHGIFQFRVWGIDFALAGLTNITPEHLDYFETYDDYAKTKGEWLLGAKQAVLNESDRSFPLLRSMFQQRRKAFLTYSQELDQSAIDRIITAKFDQPYNHWNAKLVLTMARKLGIADEVFIESIKTFPGVRGRMQSIPNTRGLEIVVDFAHTPNGLTQALTALRPKAQKNLIAVFGCAGLRDRTKRAPMGKIAAEIADLCIFTAEDPRTEDLQVILRQMKEGVAEPNHRKIVTIPDRKAAIAFALSQAKRGDVIGIFGKGHEKSFSVGKKEYPWSDQEVVAQLLESA